jgi:dsRNA-specific ribonuclease
LGGSDALNKAGMESFVDHFENKYKVVDNKVHVVVTDQWKFEVLKLYAALLHNDSHCTSTDATIDILYSAFVGVGIHVDNTTSPYGDYEALATLGDKVLSMLLMHHTLIAHPKTSRGELTDINIKYTKNCVLNLALDGRHVTKCLLRHGRAGEYKSKRVATVVEAMFGAFYLTVFNQPGGFLALQSFIDRFVKHIDLLVGNEWSFLTHCNSLIDSISQVLDPRIEEVEGEDGASSQGTSLAPISE